MQTSLSDKKWATRTKTVKIKIKKTKCMHVRRQQTVEAPGQKSAEKVCKFKCSNVGCGWIFGNERGPQIHKGKWCKWSNYYEVEKILGVEYDQLPIGIGKTKFLIKWKGYNLTRP